MAYFSQNPISVLLKAIRSIIKTLLSSLKLCFDVKKMFSILLFLAVTYIVAIPILNFIGKLFRNKKHDNDSSSSDSSLNNRKFRTISSNLSCSACKHDSSSTSSKSSKSSKSHKSSSSSTHIDKKKVEKVLRKFKITA